MREKSGSYITTDHMRPLEQIARGSMRYNEVFKPGIEEHGLAGIISRSLNRSRLFYGKLLDAILDARPAVYAV